MQALFTSLHRGWSFSGRERNCCFLNVRGPRFADVSIASGLDFPDDGRAACVVDWDHDGRLDLWLANRSGPQLRLLHNRHPRHQPFVAFRLRAQHGNRDAIGARLELHRRSGEVLLRTLRAGDGFLAQSSKWVHFGLGEHPQIERLMVRWPDGQTEEFRNLQADTHYDLVQGSGTAAIWRRPTPAIALRPEPLRVSNQPSVRQTVFDPPLPLPPITYTDFSGRKVPYQPDGQPVLFHLWASWCPNCVAELRQWSEHAEALSLGSLRIVALSVDGLREGENPRDAEKFLRSVSLPIEAGIAPAHLVDQWQLVHDWLFDSMRPLALPTSLLLNGRGELVALTQGTLSPEQLQRDRARLDTASPDALPFAGRWHQRPRRHAESLLASWLLRNGFADDAEKYLRRLAAARDDDPGIHYHLARALVQRGAFAEAEIHWQAALRLDAREGNFYVGLGNALLQQGRGDEAAEVFVQGLAACGDHPGLHDALGTLRLLQQRHDEALPLLQRAVDLAPRSAEIRTHYAAALAEAGRLAEAAEQLREALRLNPDMADARRTLTLIELQMETDPASKQRRQP